MIWFVLTVFLAWSISLSLVIPKPTSGTKRFMPNTGSLLRVLGYQNIKKEAESFGWKIEMREFIGLVFASFVIGLIIAIFIRNVFFVAVGVAMGFMVPRFVVLQIKKNRRMAILFDLPDALSLFTSRLGDFPSIQKALEISLPEMKERITEPIFRQALRELQIGISVEQVLIGMANQIKIRKFNDFAEKLLMAHSQGFHRRAINSLNQTIREMSEDIKEIETLKLKSRKEKTRLITIIIMAWLMPIVLSFLNSGNSNLFMDTTYGQIFIVSFFIATLYTITKGDDYLSLNLDEL